MADKSVQFVPEACSLVLDESKSSAWCSGVAYGRKSRNRGQPYFRAGSDHKVRETPNPCIVDSLHAYCAVSCHTAPRYGGFVEQSHQRSCEPAEVCPDLLHFCRVKIY